MCNKVQPQNKTTRPHLQLEDQKMSIKLNSKQEKQQREMMKGIQTGVNNILIFNTYKVFKDPFSVYFTKQKDEIGYIQRNVGKHSLTVNSYSQFIFNDI
jgi:hypothetical protein